MLQDPYEPNEFKEHATSTKESLGILLMKKRKGKIMKKGIKNLEALGFVKERPDPTDRNYVVYRKDIKHWILKDLHICVEDEYITVFCKDIDNKGDVVIVKRKRKPKTLYKILHWMSTTGRPNIS
jgi:hypothetical protein